MGDVLRIFAVRTRNVGAEKFYKFAIDDTFVLLRKYEAEISIVESYDIHRKCANKRVPFTLENKAAGFMNLAHIVSHFRIA